MDGVIWICDIRATWFVSEWRGEVGIGDEVVVVCDRGVGGRDCGMMGCCHGTLERSVLLLFCNLSCK